jgi:excisionase family DNA binding protein
VKKLSTQVPRLALTPSEAAASIGVGPDFFEAHVAPELRIVRRGRKRLISLAELERWLAANADDSVAQEINPRP